MLSYSKRKINTEGGIMAKRIFFTQQKPYDFMPLRVGIGLISIKELREYSILRFRGYNPEMLCKKIYTTRTHRLSGEYIVVEGSRFKAKPVEPEIKFQVKKTWELSLKYGLIYPRHTLKIDNVWGGTNILEKDGLTFPELDLGIKSVTFEHLRDELLRLNKKATIETPFYVNLLEPLKPPITPQ
jgi:hypothetical protein